MKQPIILHIETSTHVCSVALSEGSTCLFSEINNDGMNHAALLSVFISQAMEVLKQKNKKLDAVAVSSGPGSYTGLRIGVSTAKGLCYGLDIPMISVSTLEVITKQVLNSSNFDSETLFCPMIDARRMEVYAAIYNTNIELIREISPDIIDENSYQDYLQNKQIVFFGNGSEKCKIAINHANAVFIEDINPMAENMISFGLNAFLEKDFVDVAYFEPFYLKEFQTTTPKKL